MMAVATRNTHPSSISLEFEELLKGEHRDIYRTAHDQRKEEIKLLSMRRSLAPARQLALNPH